MIARLVSSAGTGYTYTTRRLRTADKLNLIKYDPKGTFPLFLSRSLSRATHQLRSPTTRPVQRDKGVQVINRTES